MYLPDTIVELQAFRELFPGVCICYLPNPGNDIPAIHEFQQIPWAKAAFVIYYPYS